MGHREIDCELNLRAKGYTVVNPGKLNDQCYLQISVAKSLYEGQPELLYTDLLDPMLTYAETLSNTVELRLKDSIPLRGFGLNAVETHEDERLGKGPLHLCLYPRSEMVLAKALPFRDVCILIGAGLVGSIAVEALRHLLQAAGVNPYTSMLSTKECSDVIKSFRKNTTPAETLVMIHSYDMPVSAYADRDSIGLLLAGLYGYGHKYPSESARPRLLIFTDEQNRLNGNKPELRYHLTRSNRLTSPIAKAHFLRYLAGEEPVDTDCQTLYGLELRNQMLAERTKNVAM